MTEHNYNMIICGAAKDHECNEDATVYETSDGERHFFVNRDEANEWYDNNCQNTIMGSVACTICGDAAIDRARNMI